ncbi:hypothetical protein VitviT2T_024708 [Vitis vinifera]|uniref:Uncharacterized protein n=1 Tax=Vitis vinifera TaxID=29760 RepID=A0ABY9DIG1_VITVI|nr:hypothetical protein VitviT2T_024708 [Vitis vinifera]
MASRRESTASRAQGKHPTESSQPAQTEACQKARFDTTLFSTMEDYQRYKQNFAQRKVVPRRKSRSRVRTPEVSLGGEIVSKSEGWSHPSNPLVFIVGAWVNVL